MSFGQRFAQKPPLGTQIDWSNPLAGGLDWFAPFNEGGGGKVADIVAHTSLAFSGSPSWSAGGSSVMGSGLLLTATNSGVNTLIPASVQANFPCSLVCAFRWTGTAPDANSNILCTQVNTTNSSSNAARLLWTSTAATIGIIWPAGSVTNIAAVTAGVDYVVVVSFGVTSQSAWVFGANGTLTTFAQTVTLTQPSWQATSSISIGQQAGGTARNSQILFYWGGLLGRAITGLAEAAQWAASPWQIFRPNRGVMRSYVAPPAGGANYWGRSANRPWSRPITGPAVPLIYG